MIQYYIYQAGIVWVDSSLHICAASLRLVVHARCEMKKKKLVKKFTDFQEIKDLSCTMTRNSGCVQGNEHNNNMTSKKTV